MVSVKQECSNCYHYKSMRCPSSEKCYSKVSKPYWVMGKGILMEYHPTILERIKKLFKTRRRI